MMNKGISSILILTLIAFIAASAFASADMSDFSSAINIVQQNTPCSDLNQSQLIDVGDYYMQLMLGSAHDRMDAMMGGDDAPMDQQMHISIAERYYCNGITPSELNSTNANYGYGMMYSGYNSNYGNQGYTPRMMYGYYNSPFEYYMPLIFAIILVSFGAIIAVILTKKARKR